MLILARHGQTAANAEGLLLGRADVGLNDVGRGQAEALARAVGRPALVVTSPLARARETAAALPAGSRVLVDERWVELDYGELDGQPSMAVPAELWDRWRRDPGYAPPGGESLREVGVRVREACGQLMAQAAEHDVVVVSHVSPIKAAVAWALGVGDGIAWRMFCDVASMSRIATGGGRPVLRSFNETQHLGSKPGEDGPMPARDGAGW